MAPGNETPALLLLAPHRARAESAEKLYQVNFDLRKELTHWKSSALAAESQIIELNGTVKSYVDGLTKESELVKEWKIRAEVAEAAPDITKLYDTIEDVATQLYSITHGDGNLTKNIHHLASRLCAACGVDPKDLI